MTDKKSAAIKWAAFYTAKLLIFLSAATKVEIDTPSYFTSVFVDEFRTPVYPFICKTFKALFPAGYYEGIVWFQFIISCISCYFLWLALIKILPDATPYKKRIAEITTALYGLGIGVFAWDRYLFTESLSLSLTAIYVYMCASLLFDRESSRLPWLALASTLLSLAMVFLRPTLGITLVFTLALIVVRHFTQKKASRRALKTAAACAVCALGFIPVLLYAGQFKRQYGVFTLSSIHTRQQLATLIDGGLDRYFDNEAVTAVIYENSELLLGNNENTLYSLSVAYYCIDEVGLVEANRICASTIRSHFFEYIYQRALVFARNSSLPRPQHQLLSRGRFSRCRNRVKRAFLSRFSAHKPRRLGADSARLRSGVHLRLI